MITFEIIPAKNSYQGPTLIKRNESAKLRSLRVLVPYVLSCPTCSLASRTSCPTCSRALRASCLTCSYALVPYVPRALVPYLPREKLLIARANLKAPINKQSEIIGMFRHHIKYTLSRLP